MFFAVLGSSKAPLWCHYILLQLHMRDSFALGDLVATAESFALGDLVAIAESRFLVTTFYMNFTHLHPEDEAKNMYIIGHITIDRPLCPK